MIRIILCKFVLLEIASIKPYLSELDVLAPSFLFSFIVGIIVSRMYPPRKEAVDHLNQIVSSTLNQKSSDTNIRDGMDMVLCSIDNTL